MNVGTHITHCCIKHGCKYGDPDCPVEKGEQKQDGPCERCSMNAEGYFGEVRKVDYHKYKAPYELKPEFTEEAIIEQTVEGIVRMFENDGEMAKVWSGMTDSAKKQMKDVLRDKVRFAVEETRV